VVPSADKEAGAGTSGGAVDWAEQKVPWSGWKWPTWYLQNIVAHFNQFRLPDSLQIAVGQQFGSPAANRPNLPPVPVSFRCRLGPTPAKLAAAKIFSNLLAFSFLDSPASLPRHHRPGRPEHLPASSRSLLLPSIHPFVRPSLGTSPFLPPCRPVASSVVPVPRLCPPSFAASQPHLLPSHPPSLHISLLSSSPCSALHPLRPCIAS
jgi:hypothetical protein